MSLLKMLTLILTPLLCEHLGSDHVFEALCSQATSVATTN